MYFCAQTECCSCSIHSNVTTTDNNDFLAACDRCIITFLKCFHQVISGKEFIGREYALCLLARDSHKSRKTCTGADKDCLKSFFFHQLINRYGTTDDNICLNLNTKRLYIFYFCGNNLALRQTELRNTVNQYTTCFVQCLKNSNIIAKFCQITGTGKSCRTGADHCDLVTILFASSLWLDAIFSCPVSRETLQFSDGNGFALDSTDTLAFTLALLWADTSTNGWKCRRLADHFICLFDVAIFYSCDEIRDLNGNRASLDTLCILAVQATGCFFHSLFFIVS